MAAMLQMTIFTHPAHRSSKEAGREAEYWDIGRARGRRCTPTPVGRANQPPVDDWSDDDGTIPTWLPNLQTANPGKPKPQAVTDILVTETNCYFNQYANGTNPNQNVLRKWKPVTSNEMLAFLAIIITI